jgi:hypothetical protein
MSGCKISQSEAIYLNLHIRQRLFSCLYARNGDCMSGCKISQSEAIYLHLHIRQKWSYLAGQARVRLDVRAQ